MFAQPPLWFIILAFLCAIGPLVFFHELGHYWVARLFGVGFATAALNPKVALFYMAVLPPFLDPERGSVFLQGATLGLVRHSNTRLPGGVRSLFSQLERPRLQICKTNFVSHLHKLGKKRSDPWTRLTRGPLPLV